MIDMLFVVGVFNYNFLHLYGCSYMQYICNRFWVVGSFDPCLDVYLSQLSRLLIFALCTLHLPGYRTGRQEEAAGKVYDFLSFMKVFPFCVVFVTLLVKMQKI